MRKMRRDDEEVEGCGWKQGEGGGDGVCCIGGDEDESEGRQVRR